MCQSDQQVDDLRIPFPSNFECFLNEAEEVYHFYLALCYRVLTNQKADAFIRIDYLERLRACYRPDLQELQIREEGFTVLKDEKTHLINFIVHDITAR